MKIDEIVSRNYTFVAKADLEGGGWVIIYPDLPGVMTQADTYDEIGEMAQDALATWAEEQIESGRPIPEPTDFQVPEWDWSKVGDNNLTTKEVAEILGVTPRRVLAIAKDRQVGRKFGHSVMFAPAEVDKLRPRRVGRPKATARV